MTWTMPYGFRQQSIITFNPVLQEHCLSYRNDLVILNYGSQYPGYNSVTAQKIVNVNVNVVLVAESILCLLL